VALEKPQCVRIRLYLRQVGEDAAVRMNCISEKVHTTVSGDSI
jgi:hypothetical protein